MARGEWLSAKDVSERLGVTEQTVSVWVLTGCKVGAEVVLLRCVHAGTQYRIKPEWMEEFTEGCRRAKLGRAVPRTETPDRERERMERERVEYLAADAKE